ncbi:hypothetical protein ABZ725_49830 [Streptomyces sp. NPDC006872]|uniref:hypothetical protein n=1 Tax=Streptomyces sp. NPDC006872 TaxID=3155720 RepID=UPI0033DF20CC
MTAWAKCLNRGALQIIVCDHANPAEPWYQDAVIGNWRPDSDGNRNALIPLTGLHNGTAGYGWASRTRLPLGGGPHPSTPRPRPRDQVDQALGTEVGQPAPCPLDPGQAR